MKAKIVIFKFYKLNSSSNNLFLFIFFYLVLLIVTNNNTDMKVKLEAYISIYIYKKIVYTIFRIYPKKVITFLELLNKQYL